MKRSAITTVLRDFLSFGLGAIVILHQELNGQANYLAWAFGMVCILGVPGTNAAIGLWRGNPERDDTTKPSSSPSRQDLPG